MIKFLRIVLTSFVLVSASLPASGQNQAGGIPAAEITGLDAKLAKAGESASAARKKLAIRRVIREAEALIKKHPTASNRYEALGVLFRSQQALVSLDNSTANRKAFLETSKKLAAAPNEYAALRLDADLLLTQAESARKGADSHARSDALRPLVERYRDTDVEPKVIRIAMIMALELGNTKLVNDLRKVVAERFPGNMDLINFQREKLAGQVFGAPFIGGFERSDGTMARFPLDFLGTTTAIYCWSKEGDGLEDLKALAADWKKAKVEHNAAGRFQFVSMNMDDLPDAGEGILREHGLDWQALKMPKGQENPIYQTYVQRDTPTIVIVSPNGYVALYQSGGRSNRTYERRLQSMLASQWAQSHNTSLLQSVYSGEFLVIQPDGDFDPAAPPELKAIKKGPISGSIPADELRAIQSCFIEPPLRYSTPQNQIIANYEKANSLCLAAIAAHPKAPDLWIVRNRRITALMGLWKTRADQKAFASAVTEAKAAIESGYPRGTDVVAQLCLARQALRAPDAKPKEIIESFVKSAGGKEASAPALLAASLLALDTGDRRLHDQYRQTFLGKYATDPTMWTATSFLLDRYLRYWLYHPPYTAGWTYGRRQGHFLAIGTPEEALRTIQTELKTLEGETVKIPESSDGKWTVISFVPTAAGNGYLKRYAAFVSARPFQDTKLIVAVLDDDAESADKLLKEKAAELEKRRQQPDTFPTLLVPGGLKNPIVRQLGMVTDEEKPKNNILLIRPDGSIAVAMSGLAMSAQKGSVIQNVIEFHDEELVDKALAKGDLDEAKRLAFAHAPVEQVRPEDAPRNWKPKVLTVPHLRSRAKVYLAMGELKAAQADIQEVYLKVNTAAGYISMRTKELEETEALKASILTALEKAE
ncbi:thioredoxin family protein [bacterium]|nr:thioredoxin family protein [bacterium]MDB4753050.1 thioredoxin family protein [bacterium]